MRTNTKSTISKLFYFIKNSLSAICIIFSKYTSYFSLKIKKSLIAFFKKK